jgi:hypothetical protein
MADKYRFWTNIDFRKIKNDQFSSAIDILKNDAIQVP